jgi:uncharacterized membrane-anchored protein YitT (DUF2179 family)
MVGIAQIASWLCTGTTALMGIFNLLINIPLFIVSYKALSRGFLMKTIVSLIIQNLILTFVTSPADPVLPDVLASVIFGGVIGGVGVGLCLQSGGSAGGLDILGMYFSKKLPDFSVGRISYIVNFFVLSVSGLLFDLQTALYSVIFIVLLYFAADQVHYQNINVYAIIITDVPKVKEELCKTGRGVTWWNGQGAYTGDQKEILLCIMNKYEVRRMKKIVHSCDPKAFFLLTRGNPVLGNFEKRLLD